MIPGSIIHIPVTFEIEKWSVIKNAFLFFKPGHLTNKINQCLGKYYTTWRAPAAIVFSSSACSSNFTESWRATSVASESPC